MNSKRSPKKPYWEMNLDELRQATKEFDRPTDLSKTRPLSKDERQRWVRSKKEPSYSIRVFSGGKRRAVTIRLDEDLIRWSEHYARQHHMTRDELIARSLRSVQSFAE